MVCKKCGLKDGYAPDMFNPKRLICDVCGGDEWISFKQTKVTEGETRKVIIPLVMPPFIVMPEGRILKIGTVGKSYAKFENCDIMINEIREDVFNEDNILDDSTKRKKMSLSGGSLMEMTKKWIYENTEVVNGKI